MNSNIAGEVSFHNKTILLVEDQNDDVILMQMALSKASVSNPLKVVIDGEQAVSYLNGDGQYSDRQHFPIPIAVLLDLNLPKRNGLEVLSWIRSNPKFDRLTVIILTASHRASDVEKAAALGANLYMIKPGKMSDLIELVRSLYSVLRFAVLPPVEANEIGSSEPGK
jgi:CheY-like chemotaxis protein